MNFKVGDVIKKPTGKSRFKILKSRELNHRFGDIFLENLDSGNKYWSFINQGWILSVFLEPKKTINKKFNFKNGI